MQIENVIKKKRAFLLYNNLNIGNFEIDNPTLKNRP